MRRLLTAALAAVLLVAPALSHAVPVSQATPVAATAQTYSSSQPNAVERTLQSKLDDVISGLDFHMVGDNSTDNSTALARALAATGDGRLFIPCGTYKFSTPIALTAARPMIEGASTRCTKLVYTGSSGVGITFNATVSSGNRPGFGLRNITVQGPSAAGSTVGVQIGDPANIGTSQAQFFTAENADVNGFGTGVRFGSGTWLSSFRGSSIHDNGVNLSYPATLTNAGEELNFTDTTFWNTSAGPANCVDIEGYVVNINFKGGSFDNCPVTVNSSNTHVLFEGVHFEAPAGAAANPYVTQTSGYVTYSSVNVYMNVLPTSASLFSAAAGSVVAHGMYLYNNSGAQLPLVFSLSGTASLNESLTHPVVGTNGVLNFALNTGTGAMVLRTPPSLLRSSWSTYEDPEGDGNFGKVATAAHPRRNAGPINLVKQSNNFTDSSWGTYSNAPTLTANSTDVTDPWGGNTMTKFVNGSGGNAGLVQNGVAIRVPGVQYTSCIWARTLSGTQTVRVGPDDTAGSFTATTSLQRFCSTQTAPTPSPLTGNKRVIEIYLPVGASPVYICCASTVPGPDQGVYVPTTTAAFTAPALITYNGFATGGPAAFGGITDLAYLNTNGWPSFVGTAPTVSSCGTSTLDSNATNTSGTVTFAGSPASCTITFAKSGYTTFNHCRVISEAGLAGFGYSYTLTALTVTASALTGKADWECDGQ